MGLVLQTLSQQCPHPVGSGTVSGLLFLLFSSMDSKAGVEDWAEVTGGQMAGAEIANEEIAFGNSVKTSGTIILREKEDEDEAQETWDLLGDRRGVPGSGGPASRGRDLVV